MLLSLLYWPVPILTERACESWFGGSQLAVNQKTWHKDIKRKRKKKQSPVIDHQRATVWWKKLCNVSGNYSKVVEARHTLHLWPDDSSSYWIIKKKKDVTHYLLFPYQWGGDFHLIVLLNWVIPPLTPAYRDGAALKHSTDCSNCKPPEVPFLCPNIRQP